MVRGETFSRERRLNAERKMRPSLRYPLRERRAQARPGARRAQLRLVGAAAHRRQSDPSLEQARAAGGPTDRASYVCGCGLMFIGEVSTTVVCPHCGCEQAW
jgi:hypothetical protein